MKNDGNQLNRRNVLKEARQTNAPSIYDERLLELFHFSTTVLLIGRFMGLY